MNVVISAGQDTPHWEKSEEENQDQDEVDKKSNNDEDEENKDKAQLKDNSPPKVQDSNRLRALGQKDEEAGTNKGGINSGVVQLASAASAVAVVSRRRCCRLVQWL